MRKSLKKLKDDRFAKIARRKLHIRKKINGTSEAPRLCTVKTNKHISVQVIDDQARKTLFSVATYGKNGVTGAPNKETAKKVGHRIAELLKKHNVAKAVFDRNGRKYTGVIAQVADAIRENGIKL